MKVTAHVRLVFASLIAGAGFAAQATGISASLGPSVMQVEAGSQYACALLATGEVRCGGLNDRGQLGDGSFTPRTAPVAVGGVSNVIAIATGVAHACSLTASGAVHCWGAGSSAQLGNNESPFSRSTALAVGGLPAQAVAITATNSTSCALLTTGDVYCWGNNNRGQLGRGTVGGTSGVPMRVLLAGPARAISATAGSNTICAILTTGALHCWGSGLNGVLGNGTTVDSGTPAPVTGLSNIVRVSVSTFNACAADAAGLLSCWGGNTQGQLGIGTSDNNAHPLPVAVPGAGTVREIASAGDAVCIVNAARAVICWGSWPTLGDGTPASPARLSPGAPAMLAAPAARVSGGSSQVCATMISGAAACWGTGVLNASATATLPVELPTLRGNVTGWATGFLSTCWLTGAGAVQCLGPNASGQLGDGSFTPRTSPVPVVGLDRDVVQLVSGNTYGNGAPEYRCALTRAGGVKCWGENSSFSLGNGSNVNSNVPVDVTGLTSGVTSISAHGSQACAVLATGALKCWGSGYFLPLNGYQSAGVPVDMAGLGSGVTQVSVGRDWACAIKDGAVSCWGRASEGQMGNNNTVVNPSPLVPVPSLASGVVRLSHGQLYACALLADGTVKCWGTNNSGQAGVGSASSMITQPTAISGGPYTAIAMGSIGGCAMTAAGAVSCWGAARSVGDGSSESRTSPIPVLAGARSIHNSGFACASMLDGGSKCWGDTVTNLFGTGNGLSPVDLLRVQTVDFAVPAAPMLVGGNAVVTGTSSLGTPVVLAAHSPASCSLQGFTLIANAPAVCSLRATEAGTDTIAPAVALMKTVVIAAPVPPPRRASDLNGDGKSDLVFQNADGRIAAWLMDGTVATASANLIGAGAGWSVTHTADLGGDGKGDIFFKHTDGRVYVYTMDGLTVTGGKELLGAGLGWSIGQVADVNGDGKADLVLRNADGREHLWTMDGTAIVGSVSLLPAGSGWTSVATGDLNGDGKADLVFMHTDGRGYIYLMNGTTIIGGAGFLSPGSGWTVTHVGDLNGDGKGDLLFRHVDGRAHLFLMDGAAFGASAEILPAGSGWSISHVGDLNGDGKADLVFRHTDGRAHVRLMNGIATLNAADILPAGAGWSVTQLLDLNGDGKQDLVFRNVNGSITVRLMDGLAILGSANLIGPGGWSVVPPAP